MKIKLLRLQFMYKIASMVPTSHFPPSSRYVERRHISNVMQHSFIWVQFLNVNEECRRYILKKILIAIQHGRLLQFSHQHKEYPEGFNLFW
jgi:hypothetical protein